MRRLIIPVFIIGAIVALTLACYGRAVYRGEQFAYRDAAHYYYPLNQRVQSEWNAGRWPLWEPEENAGMPLLGNPTAAVLYPGKLVFAVLPYPLAARVYIIGHTLLAVATMLALLRSWRLSWAASALGATAYAFSGPILFQYCNIIFLVGAAWLPLGIRAVDRWLRLGRGWGILELALALAMQTLGGDPESAYLTGVAAGLYALALAWSRGRPAPGNGRAGGRKAWWLVPLAILAVLAWVGGTLGLAWLAPRVREHREVPVALPGMSWVAPAVLAVWCLVGGFILWRSSRRGRASRGVLLPMLAGLAGAAVLAGAVSAAQLFPVMEFTSLSVRAAGEGPHDIYPFSLNPVRVVELVWPNVFGTTFHGNRSVLPSLPPTGKDPKIWVPTLYNGVLAAVLALSAIRWRSRCEPWRVWMTAIVGASLLGSFGEFTSPLLWARQLPAMRARVGPLDPQDVTPIRRDDHLRDGDGSLYGIVATGLPGFRQFRFPSKLLTFTVLGLAALAAVGWDELMAGEAATRRRAIAWAAGLLALTIVGLVGLVLRRAAVVALLEQVSRPSAFGPFDASGAWADSLRGLAQGAVVLAVALAVAWRGHRWPRLAAATALAVMAADLALANACQVITAPQHLFDEPPEVMARIQEAEAKRPSPDPYRIHRTAVWNPVGWIDQATESRVGDFVAWERGTLQPKYGITEGVHYTTTLGVAELFDYEFFFAPFPVPANATTARILKVDRDSPVIYHPRRSYDMWTSRYFVLPYYPKWTDEHRGIASFLDQAERVYPPIDAFSGPGGRDREIDWIKQHDYLILRNLNVYPRAWIVHGGRFLPPIFGLVRADRQRPMEELLYAGDQIWNSTSRVAYDPHTIAWFESDDRLALSRYLPGPTDTLTEAVRVIRLEPDRVELEAELSRPGVVVLADAFYPGWNLTVDGKPAVVYRVNRMMRGAALGAGKFHLVYTFRPWTWRAGLVVSGFGLAALGILGVVFWFRPVLLTPRPATPSSVSGKTAGPTVSSDLA